MFLLPYCRCLILLITFSYCTLSAQLMTIYIVNQVRKLNEKEELALLLEKQYPSDVGVISSFFFNYVKLNPGEALYIGANEPHAYVSGECLECMATSDNVVRAGLTPKFRDVQTLCSMLTYKQVSSCTVTYVCTNFRSSLIWSGVDFYSIWQACLYIFLCLPI